MFHNLTHHRNRSRVSEPLQYFHCKLCVPFPSSISCYQLQDGHFRVRLITPFCHIPDGVAVEIFGEIRLIEKNTTHLYTPSDLITELRDLQLRSEDQLALPLRDPTGLADIDINPTVRCQLETKLNDLQNNYIPAILVHSFRCIDQPKQMITCNLDLRIL
jgi:hypothetical protein